MRAGGCRWQCLEIHEFSVAGVVSLTKPHASRRMRTRRCRAGIWATRPPSRLRLRVLLIRRARSKQPQALPQILDCLYKFLEMYPVLLQKHHPPPRHSTSIWKVFETVVKLLKFLPAIATAAAAAAAQSQPYDRQAGEGTCARAPS